MKFLKKTPIFPNNFLVKHSMKILEARTKGVNLETNLFKTMVRRQRLTTEQRLGAVGMMETGLSHREVAGRIECGRCVIDKLAARYQETGWVVDRPRSGRPRVTTQRQDAYIVLSARRSNLRNASRLRDRNRFHARGIHARRPLVRPVLTRQHIANRLVWYHTHIRWTMANWRMTVFSDESMFMVTPTDGQARVWREHGQRYAADNVVHRDC